MSLVEVEDLSVAFGTRRVVDGVSFTLDRGETLALVGESGSGKSLTALSLLQLLPTGGVNPTGRVTLGGKQMIGADPETLRRARGELAGIIFQEPMTSLNPLHRIGKQVAEAVTLHRPLRGAALRARPPGLHVVVTGRNARPALVEAADLVTEMAVVKHHFAAGVKAQEGVEF